MRRLPRECADSCDANICPRCGRVHSHPDSGFCHERECRKEHKEAEREIREIRNEIHKEERREERQKCRCPYCGHDFVWPPEPCPRCGRIHEPRQPWVSPSACEDDDYGPVKPKAEGGFSQLFGNLLGGGGGSIMNILLMMMLFGGGLGGISQIKNLFMHPMFQLLEKMGDPSKGGNMMDALGPLLGADMGALSGILANLGKKEEEEL